MPRLADILVALVAGLILLIPMILVAVAIRAALGAPVFFTQVRSGRHGRPFSILKFRTMTNARDSAGELLPDEARQTALTRTIRRLRLDEMPQLASILAGHMALVGPRPLLPATIQGFGALGARRGEVRPGVTGWAQVSGNTALSDEEKLALDLWYVGHRSLGLDLRIVMETLLVVLMGERKDEGRLDRARAWLALSPETRALAGDLPA